VQWKVDERKRKEEEKQTGKKRLGEVRWRWGRKL